MLTGGFGVALSYPSSRERTRTNLIKNDMNSVKYISNSVKSAAIGNNPEGVFLQVGEWIGNIFVRMAWYSKQDAKRVVPSDLVKDGDKLITDNGNWTRQGKHYREHYVVKGGKAVFEGKQLYWTSVAGKFDTEGAGVEYELGFNDSGDLCVAWDKNIVTNI